MSQSSRVTGHVLPLGEPSRRRRRIRAIAVLAAVAFALGAIFGAGHAPSYAHALASRFVSAWGRRDYAAMYADIDASAQRTLSVRDFADAYEQADATATATRLTPAGKPRDADGSAAAVLVPVRVRTRLFGTLAATVRLPLQGSGAGVRVAWSRALLFPGLRPGEQLTRETALAPRAALLARDGSTLAGGPALAAGQRDSPLGTLAGAVVGSLGAIPAARRRSLEAQGVPADALVGVSGLELTFDDRLRGTPGGTLLAGRRVLASAAPRAAAAVRTTISPSVQSAAVAALGGQYGGVVAMAPNGQILAVAGIGLDDLQPPGSTFKMVTLAAALAAGVAHTSDTFPYATSSTLDGVKLSNAHGESCGGTLALAFAVSCNSVFAPLGVRVGAARLVATAERFGFNRPPGVPGAVQSSIPPAAQIQGELDVGSTAIGQGEVQASALEMASVAATIADGGVRPAPTFDPDAGSAGARVRATSAAVARTVRRLMIDVVREGTGTAAAIAGVTVAGKTGTAELGNPASCAKSEASGEAGSSESSEAKSGESGGEECLSKNDPRSTDAWFAAFAPALHPRIVVGVLLVRDGAGGETAAPVARQVLLAGLHAGGSR